MFVFLKGSLSISCHNNLLVPDDIDHLTDFVFILDDCHLCTSMEVEEGLNKICVESGKAFDNVIDNIKKLISESKNGNDRLTEREYSYINGSISHWIGPAAELGKGLFDNYEGKVKYLLKSLRVQDVSEEDIQEVIKIRNQLTHSENAVITDRTLNTVLVLFGVVYACGVLFKIIKSNIFKGFSLFSIFIFIVIFNIAACYLTIKFISIFASFLLY